MTACTRKAGAPKEFALALALLGLGVASGDIGHAFASDAWHGLGPTALTAGGPPAAPDNPAPASPHVASNCPLCRAGRVSSVALNGAGACSATAIAGTHCAVFLPETPAPSAPRRRADTSRAPPARLIV